MIITGSSLGGSIWQVEESETLPVLLQSLTAEETQAMLHGLHTPSPHPASISLALAVEEVGVCDPPELESKASELCLP